MTRETIKRLFVVTTVALLLMAGAALPLCTVLARQPDPLKAHAPALRAVAVQTEVTGTPTETSTPTSTLTSTPTLTPPTSTPTPSVTLTGTVGITELLPVEPLTETVTPSPEPTDTPTPTATPTPTPTVAPTATITPTVEGVPKLIVPFDVERTLSENWPLAVAACGIGLFVFLGLLLIVLGLRRRKPQPLPSPPPSPSPSTASKELPLGPYLESVDAAGGLRRFDLKPEGTIIGRASENDLAITQDLPGWETVSRQHARVYQQAGRWIVEDLDSMNGVWVNGRRTGCHNLLQDGWKLGVGGVEFSFHTGPREAE